VSEKTPTADEERQYVLVTKNGHRYLFCYRRGEERDLYFRLIDCARDPETEIGWPEVFMTMEHLAPFSPEGPSRK